MNNEMFKKLSGLEKSSAEYISTRNQIVQLNMDLVHTFINTKCKDLEWFEYEDLYQSCLLWLFEAADNFCNGKRIKHRPIHSTFAGYASAFMMERLKKTLNENECPDIDSLDEMYDDEEESYLYDKPAEECIVFGYNKEEDYDPDKFASYFDLRYNLSKLLNTLTEKEKIVIILRFFYNKTYDECGKYFNLTKQRIRQIEAKALRKLRHPTRSKLLVDYFLDNMEFGRSYGKIEKRKYNKSKEETIMARAKKVAEKAAEEKVVTEEKKAVQEETPKTVYTTDQQFNEYFKTSGKKDSVTENIISEAIETVKETRRLTHVRKKKNEMEKMADAIGVANPALALAMQAQMHLDANQIDKLTTMIENDDVFVTQAEYISFYVKPMMDYLNKIVLRDYPHLKVKLLDDRDHANYVFEDKTVKADTKKTTETSEDTECPKGFISFRVLEDILNLINECKRDIYTPSTDFYDKVIEDILLAVNTNKYGMSRILCTMDELIELKGKIKEILEKVNTSENNIIKNTLLNNIANVINKYHALNSLSKPEQIDKFIDDIVKQGNKSVKGELEE